MKILCVCLSATIQRTLRFGSFSVGKVNRTSDFREDASGKAVNSARVLNQLSPGCAEVICPVGRENGGRFLELAARDCMVVHAVEVGGKVRECWTLLGREGETSEVVADENGFSGDASENSEAFVSAFCGLLGGFDAVLFSGSRPVSFGADINKRICSEAKNNGKTLFVDFTGESLLSVLEDECSRPDVVKINEEEFLGTFYPALKSCPRSEKVDIVPLVLEKSSFYGVAFVVTAGSGPTIAASDGRLSRCESERIPPGKLLNTTACGDSFGAGFLFEFAEKRGMEEALRKGTWCASRNAESMVPGSVL